MIPFRAATPSTVTNPTSDPSDSTPPVIRRAGDAPDKGERKPRPKSRSGQPDRPEVGLEDAGRCPAATSIETSRMRVFEAFWRGILAQKFRMIAPARTSRL